MAKLEFKCDYTMILDAEHLTHRAFYAFSKQGRELVTVDGKDSGTFFGFFSILLGAFRTHGVRDMYVCWGDKRDNLARKDIYPAYKEGRHVMPDEYYAQVEGIRSAIGGLGYTQFWSPRQEGDDAIAQVLTNMRRVDSYMGDDKKFLIYTGDKDLMQLVDDKAYVLNSNSHGPDRVYTAADVLNKFDVPPELLADYLTLMGDRADNVPGVPGVGEKTAAKLLNNYGPIKTWFHDIQKLDIPDKMKQKLVSNKEAMVISKKLISLKNVDIPLEPLVYDSTYSPDEIFDKYSMRKIRPHHFMEL